MSTSRALRTGAALVTVAVTVGCGASLGQSADGRRPSALAAAVRPPVRGSGDVLTGAEIRHAGAATARDAVSWLRPQFLMRRTPLLPADPYGGFPIVYLDGVRQGGLEMLGTIPAEMITEIRYLTAATAYQWFGGYNPGGAIAISTRP